MARLEESGYIRRKEDKEDRRAMRVYLTARGRKLRPQLETAAVACIESLTLALDTDERLEMRRLLAKMALPFVPPG